MSTTWDQILRQPVVTEVIKPKTWGSSCWTFLHCIALAYPLKPSPEDQDALRNYFHALSKVLPCYTCKMDFTQMLEADPISQHLHSREALCRWLHQKHNAINQKTGAPVQSFESSIERWAQGPRTRPSMMAAQVGPATGSECKECFQGWSTLVLVLIAVGALIAIFAVVKK